MGAALCKSERDLWMQAAREGEVTAMEAMLSKKGKRKVGVNLKDQEGNTALHIAAEAGMLNVIKLILSRGGIINATNSVGFTALNLACRGGHEKCIRFLVESGAELEVPDTAYGNTALLWAVGYCNVATISFLCDKGARLDARNRQGFTALMMSADAGSLEKTQALLAHNADPSAKDSRGNTAVSRAQARNFKVIVEELNKAIAKAAKDKADAAEEEEADAKAKEKEDKKKAAGGGKAASSAGSSARKGR